MMGIVKIVLCAEGSDKWSMKMSTRFSGKNCLRVGIEIDIIQFDNPKINM